MTVSGDERDGSDEGPGRGLRRERESRGLTTQQVAEQLNLDVTVVEAIEGNDFPSLGAPVFARGHLRRYATLFGLPDHDLLAQYDRARQPEDPTLIPRAHIERQPERKAPRWPWISGGLLAFVAAAIAAWYVSEFGFALPDRAPAASSSAGTDIDVSRSVPEEIEADNSGSASAGPAAGAAGPPGTSAVPDAARATTAESPPPASTGPPGSITLEFRFDQDSWLEIFDGTGKAVLYDLGEAGSRRAISALPPLNVTVGNAPAVHLSVDGKSVRLPAPEAGQTVVRVRVDASGVLR